MGSIEKLPTVIFQLIQQCARENEYRHLMNCNKETFSSVKKETVNFSLRINGTAEKTLRRLLNSVKDKSKQISVTFIDMNQSEIKKYVKLCDCIEDVSVDGRPRRKSFVFFDSFRFTVFNNILHLTLTEISGMCEVNLYLENCKIRIGIMFGFERNYCLEYEECFAKTGDSRLFLFGDSSSFAEYFRGIYLHEGFSQY
jgi:hypothetical protein